MADEVQKGFKMKLKMLALIVLLATSLNAQSPEALALHLNQQLDGIAAAIDIRNQIDSEFSAMTVELSGLNNVEVAKIMLPHIIKIERLKAKLDRSNPPDRKKGK